MKCCFKRIIVGIMVLVLAVTGICVPLSSADAASGTYWLYGHGTAGGEKKTACKMYYQSGKIILKGTVKKSSKKSAKWYSQEGKTLKSKTRKFKAAKNCKVYECEGMEEYGYNLKEFIDERNISEKKDWAGISVSIRIVKGKAAKIYLYA